jgi:hypothetical protein
MSEREEAPGTAMPTTATPETAAPKPTESRPAGSTYRPSGAIFVTTLVTGVTLVLWFGTYALNALRG